MDVNTYIYTYKKVNNLAGFDVLSEWMCWMGWGAEEKPALHMSLPADVFGAVNNFPGMGGRS